MRESSSRRGATGGLIVFLGLAAVGCATGNQSDARLLYHHCRQAESFWAGYAKHAGPKVMTAGLTNHIDGNRVYACNWSGGTTTADARAKALANCRKTYQKCYVYAEGNAEEDWVRDERIAIAREEGKAVDDFVDGFLQGIIDAGTVMKK